VGVWTHPVDPRIAALGQRLLDQLWIEHLNEILVDQCKLLVQFHFGLVNSRTVIWMFPLCVEADLASCD
jgi:hypothetical protein